MRHRGRVVEIQTRRELDHRLACGAESVSGWHFQSVDLAGCAPLEWIDVAGALFLGCTFDDETEESIRCRGGIVFPEVPDVPIDTYRSELYRPEELVDTLDTAAGYAESLDARAYGWSQQPPSRDVTLACALHDHSIDHALDTWAQGRRLVGLMGGHAATRGSPEYVEAARLGHALGDQVTVATGGGPGAMEAGNLGAWMSGGRLHEVDEAISRLCDVPSFRPTIDDWARVAFQVRRGREGQDTLGVPTWHYGHEPPNMFATAIAKYFANATREAILLEICNAGIVFLPGAAGTVQEVFQDACENYYADPSSLAPMVLVGRRYWTQRLPAWPLLRALAVGRDMQGHIHLVDSPHEAVEIILAQAASR